MRALDKVLRGLESERGRLREEMHKLEQAITALTGVGRNRTTTGARRGRKPRRRLSVAARKRIAAAQRARWAKVRQQQSKKAA